MLSTQFNVKSLERISERQGAAYRIVNLKLFNRVFVVETRGLHLKDSDDTKYKKSLFALCNERSKEMTVTELGVKMRADKVSFAIVDESEWQNQFNALFSS